MNNMNYVNPTLFHEIKERVQASCCRHCINGYSVMSNKAASRCSICTKRFKIEECVEKLESLSQGRG